MTEPDRTMYHCIPALPFLNTARVSDAFWFDVLMSVFSTFVPCNQSKAIFLTQMCITNKLILKRQNN